MNTTFHATSTVKHVETIVATLILKYCNICWIFLKKIPNVRTVALPYCNIDTDQGWWGVVIRNAEGAVANVGRSRRWGWEASAPSAWWWSLLCKMTASGYLHREESFGRSRRWQHPVLFPLLSIIVIGLVVVSCTNYQSLLALWCTIL